MQPQVKIPHAALVALASGRLVSRVPGLRRLPMLQILIAGQVLMLARNHLERLTPWERHRVVVLVRASHGRFSHLSESDRAELAALIAKMEPRAFAETAVRTMSPLPLPGKRPRRNH